VGHLDPAIDATADGVISIRNPGPVSFGFQSSDLLTAGEGVWDVVIADFNNDGAFDLLASERTNGTLSLLRGNGDGTFGNATVVSEMRLAGATMDPKHAAGADFNRDGYVVHAGDSRCYLFRGGHAHQVTRDQTIAQRLADARVLTPDQARESSWRNVVWSAVGGGTDGLHTEVYKLDLEPRDVLLLCTDGLTKHVADDEIASVLGNGSSAEETCRRLVGMANEAGGTDNITVAVAAFS
jgi:serine/threonine protein phosphatase PrpC